MFIVLAIGDRELAAVMASSAVETVEAADRLGRCGDTRISITDEAGRAHTLLEMRALAREEVKRSAARAE